MSLGGDWEGNPEGGETRRAGKPGGREGRWAPTALDDPANAHWWLVMHISVGACPDGERQADTHAPRVSQDLLPVGGGGEGRGAAS